MSEGLPPHDVDAEAALISSMLLDGEAIALVADKLEPRHFFVEANRRVCEAIYALTTAGDPVDIVSVAGHLRESGRLTQVGGAAHLAKIVDSTPAVTHVEHYADTVIGHARIRELMAECQKIGALAKQPIADVQAFIDQAEHAIFKIADTADRREIATAAEVARDAYKQIQLAAKNRGKVECTTGLVTLDAKTGGLHAEELTVLAARPGMGKTGLVCNIAYAVAKAGKPVLFIELEMPREQLVKRMACGIANLDLSRVSDGYLERDEWSVLSSAMNEISKLPIYIDDTAGVSLLKLRAKARRVASRWGLGLIVVDYLQLMEADRARDNSTRDEDVSTITRGIKRLAREMKVPILLLSQLNRQNESRQDKRPAMSDLRESGAIEQDADNIIFIFRPEYYTKEKTTEQDKGVAELIIEKQRNRAPGKVRVRFDGPSVMFTDIPVPEPTEPTPEYFANSWMEHEENRYP